VGAALLLDLDRTLVDVQSFTDYDAAWRDVLDLVGADRADLGPDTGWSTATRACMTALARLPAGPRWEAVSGVVAEYERAAVPRSVPMPGVARFLDGLPGRPTGVVTLLPTDVASAVLEHHGLSVSVIVGRDPVVRPKPSGDGLLRALELLAAPLAGAVMVGDSTWDAAAARAAGVGFVGVHSPPEEFRDDFPEAPVCASLADVLRHVR
jgi:phosphoglycolate phosphatase